jgi:hypothetical protein
MLLPAQLDGAGARRRSAEHSIVLSHDHGDECCYFSLRTPLKLPPLFFASMKRPVVALRFTQTPLAVFT